MEDAEVGIDNGTYLKPALEQSKKKKSHPEDGG